MPKLLLRLKRTPIKLRKLPLKGPRGSDLLRHQRRLRQLLCLRPLPRLQLHRRLLRQCHRLSPRPRRL